jgi:hypothetical protein
VFLTPHGAASPARSWIRAGSRFSELSFSLCFVAMLAGRVFAIRLAIDRLV